MQKSNVNSGSNPGEVEQEVLRRYGAGAEKVEVGLCCPTEYEPEGLSLLPAEIVEKDYGCGDPMRYVESGEHAVDLGCGVGKVCYLLSKKVGAEGQVTGIDFNDKMLSVARKYQGEMQEKLGYANVQFHKAKIQDLALGLDRVEGWLAAHPIDSVEKAGEYESYCDQLRRESPMIADGSVDVIVSNCVLNLVKTADKKQLFGEMYRVLRNGGRAVISDIVSDEHPSEAILSDPKLWSGCIAGAFQEDEFLEMFESAGFYGIEILQRQKEPWQVIDGIEFRSMTVRAYKGKEGPCLERHQSVVYKGPWKSVQDDDGHYYQRGKRMAVCDKTFRILTGPKGPYSQSIEGIEPVQVIEIDSAQEFLCKANAIRDPRQQKGSDYRETRGPEEESRGPSCC